MALERTVAAQAITAGELKKCAARIGSICSREGRILTQRNARDGCTRTCGHYASINKATRKLATDIR